MPISRRTAAEYFGTFWLVLGGCGSAALLGEKKPQKVTAPSPQGA